MTFGIDLLEGDCLAILPTLPSDSFDSCVTDPPYHLTAGKKGGSGAASVNPNSPAGRAMIGTGFMGKAWDGGNVAFRPETWVEVFRVMKPGAHLVAFGGTRTYHRMACAIEDAGFEIRDTLAWIYGSGFPKSHDVAKGIDKSFGRAGDVIPTGEPAARMIPGADQNGTGSWIKDSGRTYQPGEYRPATDEAAAWDGWGSALKPAFEPIVLARKPLIGTIAANVLKHGCGGINIDACRVTLADDDKLQGGITGRDGAGMDASGAWGFKSVDRAAGLGRFPANVLHDGSDEVLAVFPDAPGQMGAVRPDSGTGQKTNNILGAFATNSNHDPRGDSGSAARFFYTAKADATDRNGSKHPTVKPLDLMQWLTRLVTPHGGRVLDPFAGSGTTGEACQREKFQATLIEREAEYCSDIRQRLKRIGGEDTPLFAAQ